MPRLKGGGVCATVKGRRWMHFSAQTFCHWRSCSTICIATEELYAQKSLDPMCIAYYYLQAVWYSASSRELPYTDPWYMAGAVVTLFSPNILSLTELINHCSATEELYTQNWIRIALHVTICKPIGTASSREVLQLCTDPCFTAGIVVALFSPNICH